MDPEHITGADWSEIGGLLAILWTFLVFAIGFGFSFLMAHAIIPSLVTTGHLPESFGRARRLFYSAAVVSLGVAAFMLARVIYEARLIEDIWGRWWI